MATKCELKLNIPDEFYSSVGDHVGVFEAVAAEGEFLEAVFCGEVDGVKLIRSLRTEEQNLVEVIEETI